LVAVLLLLQRRGRVTAAEVATELEISERTARRDLEALGLAGLPVYSQQGRGGGWRLAGGGRIDLSGLTSDEARALFLVAGPSADVTPQVKAALRKLVRALPEPLRDRAVAASEAIVIDPGDWDRTERRPPPPLLDQVQAAVIDGVQIELDYVARDRSPSRRVVDPLGLVAKGGTWYLVAQTEAGRRTFRVDRIGAIERTGSLALRPADFDLAAAWRSIAADVEELRAPVRVVGRVWSASIGHLRSVVGRRLSVGPAGDDGWVAVEIRGHSARSLAAELAGLGAALTVDEPDEVRAELADIGRYLAIEYP
jgi:predicted DNA-binding transcriptional regulator YafY